MKNKTTAALLALFLGGFGAHKFYLGRGGMGILYLLFCWTFIPAIAAFFEFILLLMMNEHDFNLKYNPGLALAAPTQQQQHQVVVNVQSSAVAGGHRDTAGKLKELHELKVAGALTEEEFQQEKGKLLSGTGT